MSLKLSRLLDQVFFFLRTWVIEAVLMGKGTVAVLREELLASLGYSAGR